MLFYFAFYIFYLSVCILFASTISFICSSVYFCLSVFCQLVFFCLCMSFCLSFDFYFFLSVCLSFCQLEQSWVKRLQEAEEEVRKARLSDTREGACQTSSSEMAGQLISAEELEVRLSAQKETLQQEATTAQVRAVEEAVRDAQREMQQKHTDDITLQV